MTLAFDPVTMDRPQTDPEFRSFLHSFVFENQSDPTAGPIFGKFLAAQGKGPHPTVILHHGFPGSEPNFDLAHAIVRAGWNVMHFHYRGTWGCPGGFSVTRAIEDGWSALEFARSERARRDFRCDPSRIALIGHSTGGFVSLHTAARVEPKTLLGVATIGCFDFGAVGEWMSGHPERIESMTRMLAPNCVFARGVTAESLVQECIENQGRWPLHRIAGKVGSLPVLLNYGTFDEVSVPDLHHAPAIKALSAVGAGRASEKRFETDHMFCQVRVSLCREIVSWLGSLA